MKARLLILFILFFSIKAYTQNTNKIKFDKNIDLEQANNVVLRSDRLISDYSFGKQTLKDLSYLLFGDTSPSEGLEATFNEDKSKISLSGGIFSGEDYLFTVKGDLVANNNGIYFFDENNGSTNAKISLNFFKSIGSSRKFDNAMRSNKVQRGYYNIESVKRMKIASLLYDYYYSWALLENYGIPTNNSNTITDFKESIARYDYDLDIEDGFEDSVGSTVLNEFIKEKKLSSKKSSVIKNISINEYDKKQKDLINSTTTVPVKPTLLKNVHNLKLDSYDIYKAIQLYEKTIISMDSIKNKLSEVETKEAQPYWNSKKLTYIGISPFYERETIKNVYKHNESLSFDKQFNDVRGDLPGVDLQLGYFYQAKKRSYLTKMFYARITGQIARGSNTNEFKKRTYEFPATSIDTLGSGIISTPNKIEGNYNKAGNTYKFGFKSTIGLETYWYPSTNLGIFGQVGYNHVEFESNVDENEVDDIEIYNLRLGILLNLKAKKKNFATLQFFADRSDLSKSPNSDDKDLRFGLKLGIPFNFKSQL